MIDALNDWSNKRGILCDSIFSEILLNLELFLCHLSWKYRGSRPEVLYEKVSLKFLQDSQVLKPVNLLKREPT